jgi:IS30 family transposase
MSPINHHKLTAQERDLIALWKGGGVSLREIARRLERSPSTISDEIRKNSYRDEAGVAFYVAIHAQAKADKRKLNARKRQPLKSQEIFAYVVDKVKRGWSPEIIAGRLRKEYGRTVICHETIYAFIYSRNNRSQRLALWEYLPRGQKKRRKQYGRRVKRVLIPGRTSIHSRPARADARQEIGHWEADTMEGKAHRNGIHAEVERLARKVYLMKIIRINGEETIMVQQKIFARLPVDLRKSVTHDNGKENSRHQRLKALGLSTYFCDPYSAWQKGSVENTIGLVRRYLPKGTDLTDITQEELNEIADELNNRPKKVLNYNTPNEVFSCYLKCSDRD